MTFVIRDWMNNPVNLGQESYESFEDARDAISEFANELTAQAVANGKYKADSEEFEDAYNGICEDLYAIEIDENGNEVKE